jgi:hypothetical protein
MCLPENPTVCYRLLPRRYGIDAHEYAAGGESQMTERAQRVFWPRDRLENRR